MKCRNPLEYDSLNSGIFSSVLPKETFFTGSSNYELLLKKIVQPSNSVQKNIIGKVDALAFQLSDFTIFFQNSRTIAALDSRLTSDRVCLYWQDAGHFSTSCPEDEHRKTHVHFKASWDVQSPVILRSKRKNCKFRTSCSMPTSLVLLDRCLQLMSFFLRPTAAMRRTKT